MEIRFQGVEMGQRVFNDLLIDSIDPSYPAIRTADVEREATDGVTPGRDYFGKRTISLELTSNRANLGQARETIARLVTAWRDSSVRLAAGELVPLEYRPEDSSQWRRVLGRPRRISDPSFDYRAAQGGAEVTAEFDVLEPLVFTGGDEGLHRVELRQAETFVAGGWTWPRNPGWPVVGQEVSGAREGALVIGGTQPTPVTVTFRGPGRKFELTGSRGWRVALKSGVELAYDESITIDPLTRRVYDNWGDPRFGALATDLFSVELDPGRENVFFSAIDQTLGASASVEWRDAFSSLA